MSQYNRQILIRQKCPLVAGATTFGGYWSRRCYFLHLFLPKTLIFLEIIVQWMEHEDDAVGWGHVFQGRGRP